jgi:hypothetical protein
MNLDTTTNNNDLINLNYSFEKIEKILPLIKIDFLKVRELFFQHCIDEIRTSKPEIEIANNSLEGKADIITKAYQLENISFYFINNQKSDTDYNNDNHLLKKIFKYLCGSKYMKCLCYSKCYNEFGENKLNKKIFYFSIDLGKYICGYQSDSVPTQFPCLNSYISSDIPKNILARTHVMSTALIISELVPNFTKATIIALNNSLNNDSKL